MTTRPASEPGELWMTTHFESGVESYTVDRADDLIRVSASYLAHARLPVDQGCITFDARNGSFRYRFAGVWDSHTLLCERVGT